MSEKTFPERVRAEFFRVARLAKDRWRLLAAALGVVVIIGVGVGWWRWQSARREGEAGEALAAVNQAFRQEYPAGFYLPGGEKEEPKPDALIQRYHQVADQFEGTAAGAEARLRGANLEYSAGQYDAAVRSYDRYAADRRAPFRPVALLGKGYALQAKGDGAAAVTAFGLAAEAAPSDPVAAEAYLAQGRALETLKKRDEALRAYGLVTEKFPQTSWAIQATDRTTALR